MCDPRPLPLLSREDEAVSEMTVIGGVVNVRLVAQRQYFGLRERLPYGCGGVVSDHGWGEGGEEVDPRQGAAVAEEVGDDEAAAGEAVHRAEDGDDLRLVEVVEEHGAEGVVEGAVGEGEVEDVGLDDVEAGV